MLDSKDINTSQGVLNMAQHMTNKLLKDKKSLRANIKKLLSPPFNHPAEKDKTNTTEVNIYEVKTMRWLIC